jgi:predicted CoA-substrate-specific enzyme activase
MIEYVCRYAPLELMAGFGETCRLENLPVENFSESDKLVHRNLCSFSRSLVQARSTQEGSTASAASLPPLLLTDCCNSIRRAGEALAAQGQAVFMLNLPHNDDACARRLYAHELRRLVGIFEKQTATKFDIEKFLEAWQYAWQWAQKHERQHERDSAGNEPEGPYVAVMGARASDALLEVIQDKSIVPIKNLTCTGTRAIGMPPPTPLSPVVDSVASSVYGAALCDEPQTVLEDRDHLDELLESYAAAILGQVPCMRMTNIGNRRQLVLDPDLRAIVYNTVSFCDFYGFEYVRLKNELSVPILKIETDYTPPATGELQTRVEAFFESIDNKKRPDIIVAANRSRYFVAGIDSGSTSTNAVILDSNRHVVAGATVLTGTKVSESAQHALDQALSQAGLERSKIRRIVTTGYGRRGTGLKADVLTEITCHARGAQFLNGNVRTVIDIGGQDSKVIRIDKDGKVKDFAMNDKCAAGTGRFLEMMAQSLGLSIAEMSRGGIAWRENIAISSMCSVFAQSEVVSLIAEGKELGDIIHGLDISIASKVIALAGKNRIERECMMTGGVANNMGVVRAMQEKLGFEVIVPPQPELCGALGAALSALQEP